MKPVKPPTSWSHPLDPRAKPEQQVPKHRSGGKDTQRWCLGRVGKRHQCVWVLEQRSYGQQRGEYPSTRQLRCVRPGCNKVVLEVSCKTHMRPDWPWSTAQWDTAPAFYGPGLPPDSQRRHTIVPDYVDVLGAETDVGQAT